MLFVLSSSAVATIFCLMYSSSGTYILESINLKITCLSRLPNSLFSWSNALIYRFCYVSFECCLTYSIILYYYSKSVSRKLIASTVYLSGEYLGTWLKNSFRRFKDSMNSFRYFNSAIFISLFLIKNYLNLSFWIN